MADRELALRRIALIEATLQQDDARGSTRAKIAIHWLELGEVEQAVKWYIEAARHAERNELALVPLTWAKRAVTVAANNLDAWREYKRQWALAGLEGEPERPSSIE